MSAIKRTVSVLSVVLIALAVFVSAPLAKSSVKNDMNGDGVVKMVAMGDSFSSGVGAPHTKNSPVLSSLGSSTVGSSDVGYDPATANDANACYRSDGAYGPIVAYDMGYELDFIACSGAKVSEMLHSSQYGEPIQTEAVPADADVIVLTAGGNDVGFVDYVTCVVLENCHEHSSAAARILSDSVNVLPGMLDELYSKIRAKAPHARVIVSGYIIGLDPRGSIPPVPGGMCFPYLSQSEMELTFQVRDTLNGAIRAAAQRHGFEYIDPHAEGSILNAPEASICSPSAQSANHSVSYDFFTTLQLGRSIHPTAYGYAVQAEMFKARLNS